MKFFFRLTTYLTQLKVFGSQCFLNFLLRLSLWLNGWTKSVEDAFERELFHDFCVVVVSGCSVLYISGSCVMVFFFILSFFFTQKNRFFSTHNFPILKLKNKIYENNTWLARWFVVIIFRMMNLFWLFLFWKNKFVKWQVFR